MKQNFCQQLIVGVVTCENRELNTLNTTLAMAQIAGCAASLVQFDTVNLGAWGNWRACLKRLVDLADAGKYRFLLVLEDDAVLSSGLAKYLETFSLAHDVIYSLYCANGSPANKIFREWNFGFHEVEAPRFSWGALAYLMHIDLARKILAAPPFPDRKDGTDHAIGVFCKTNKIPYLVHFPSLVKHIGAISSLEEVGGNNEYRQAKYWVSDCHEGRITVVEELRPPIVFRSGQPNESSGSLDRDGQNAMG